ncbi:acyl-CoA N-acyltransferase [Hypoxylon rubiginosum]|uniref:Acyl-CoA N-acyltransferase n=1 Tax=Hypoxylon rubiginosum TaxID=110542 RepID=A0ACB9ZGN8_9PEZI|nr:acyl-CoA N-acyltransferase [Hypoxylon rubiginosum]
MPQISFTLSGVDISDAEDIARYVLVPAMQNGPLYRTMFPQSDTVTKQQRDEIVRWYTDMLEDAFEDRWESFLKASSPNGTPIGFCAWTIEQDRGRQTDEQPRRQKRKKGTWIPETIDINSWTTLSKASRAERNRVLQNDTDICRLTFMAVDPKHQQQGIGSSMMQRICEETDQHSRCAYVLAAPEGVRLYAKFGFETVGHVETSHGIITSMLRPLQQS